MKFSARCVMEITEFPGGFRGNGNGRAVGALGQDLAG